MKNLKKLSRENLKSLNGGGIGTCGAYYPTEPPLPGEPFDCGCSNLYWCEKRSACVHKNMYSPKVCNDGL
ncbi:hypothetical protein [uncultured Chryseobacterium sp.]|uniref:bacteriocin-like protein n=1 Tax=uncultured Chryseobacterium sp. TaxID=259322 RepID=UPI0025F7F82E|nr:hypothetical protein [uncultured Chryseobacterium sp.]